MVGNDHPQDAITVRGAKLHNLKNISLAIPKGKLVVLSGVSGSGKSTLGFDILFKEAMRQYLESIGVVTFGLAKAPVDSIRGLLPAISVDQNLTNHSPRSTVGTSTEVYTYLRLLFARIGHRPCPNCGKDVPPSFDASNAGWEGETGMDTEDSSDQTYPCPHCGAPIPELSMAHFSFNKPEGACPSCTGLGTVHRVDITKLVDEQKSLSEGAVNGWESRLTSYHSATLAAAAIYYGFAFDPALPVKDFSPELRDILFYGVESQLFRRHFPSKEPPKTAREGRFEGLAANLLRRYAEHLEEHKHEEGYRDSLEDYMVIQTCPECGGRRLREESLAVTVLGANILSLSNIPLEALGEWLENLSTAHSHLHKDNRTHILDGPLTSDETVEKIDTGDTPGKPASGNVQSQNEGLTSDEARIASPVLDDMHERIARLVQVGAGYLALERPSPSISAGEAQRLRLASLLGSELSGLLYVFDEPTIGLHARDTRRMIEVLRRLRDLGNTVLVIEHDLEMIAAADYVIDFGPGAGRHGGEVVAAGAPEEIAGYPSSVTGAYLSKRSSIPLPKRRRQMSDKNITIHGARHHNLKDITISLPLRLLVAVTGVSGSGKSSLIFDILERAVRHKLAGSQQIPGEHDQIDGIEQLSKIITIDQDPLGRIPRSNAATYADVFTSIREAFAQTPEAKSRGFSARRFSFNLPGGRCERCEGTGVLSVQMHFLPAVEVRCPTCRGRRFNHETLEVRYRKHDISQVLELTVEEALDLFAELHAVRSKLQLLSDVGLGYLQLGQPATTLSGGEAQRVKLAKELGKRSKGHTLYLLDEPTTGLHLADISRLLEVLQRLVEAGNSVVVIEHNLELVKTADWVIDLGPEGGAGGGKVIAAGTPEAVAACDGSYTGQALRELLPIREKS